MRMKYWFCILALSFTVNIFAANTSLPPVIDEYEEELVDVVKMMIAIEKTIAESPNDEKSIRRIDDALSARWVSGDYSYHGLLEQYEGKYIERILGWYNTCRPVFSDFYEIKRNVWRFTEQRTGVVFIFKLVDDYFEVEGVNLWKFQMMIDKDGLRHISALMKPHVYNLGKNQLDAYRTAMTKVEQNENAIANYAVLLDDHIRYILAVAHFYSYDSDMYYDFTDQVEDMINTSANCFLPQYKIALETMSKSETSLKKIASDILAVYTELPIKISPFMQSSDYSNEVWSFMEENSQVHFTFHVQSSNLVESINDVSHYNRVIQGNK